MNRFDKYRGHGLKITHTHYTNGEDKTRCGLAYTPSDMELMTANGIPIQSQDLAARYYDGDASNDFHMTSDRIKTNDVNDLWEEHQSIIKKAKHAHHESKKASIKS